MFPRTMPFAGAAASLSRLVASLSPAGGVTTIRARLYFAFGCAAAMTIVCSLIALYAFTAIGGTATEIASRIMPATVHSLRLSEEASRLIASAPKLMAVEDGRGHAALIGDVTQQGENLTKRINNLQQFGEANIGELKAAQSMMLGRLNSLDAAVSDRLFMSAWRQNMAGAATRAHEQFVEGITPVVGYVNLDLMARSETSSGVALALSIEILRRLLEIQSDANLLAGALSEASTVTEASRLEPLRGHIGSARRRIETNLRALAGFEHQQKLSELYHAIIAADQKDGLVDVRGREIAAQREAERIFAETQAEAVKLQAAVDRIVERERLRALAISDRASDQMAWGRLLLIVISLFAVAAAVLIAWLYVGRNIVRRLGMLSDAMRRIARGDLDVSIPDKGNDEIAEMARTLSVFRNTTAEVTTARQGEVQRAEQAEDRRRIFDAATAQFEQAVSEIVGSLDSASETMGLAARAMSESAARNQSKATATVNASEQATQNVANVAASAEQIAISVDEVTTRVQEAASIAREAAGNAQHVTGIVEGLSNSVEQIGEISKTIRSIASQTNLLALNATIEAARAGESGRGFAVVAQEVKALAAQTQRATANIAQQTDSIMNATKTAVEAMKSIAQTIGRIDGTTTLVTSAVVEQGATTQDIARGAAAAAIGTREVASNIEQVSSAAAETEKVAVEVLSAAAGLAERSNRLKSEVERFLTQVRAA
jgi:methyl-accepting chemotaxis protein